MRDYLPIANGFYVSQALPVAAQECTNLYVNIPQTQGLTQAQLFSTPGLSQVAFTGIAEPNRGAHVVRNIPYFVNGNTLYKLTRTLEPDGTYTFTMVSLGTISGSGRVSMADNGTQLCIVVPDSTGYIYNVDTDTLTEISDAPYFDLGPSKQVTYVDGYFVHISQDTIYNSALNDGLSYGALDFAEAESDPDDIVGQIVHRRQLFIGGRNTIEVFQNVGSLNFPFQRVSGAIIPIGVLAKDSLVEYNGTFAFLGADTGGQAAIYQYTGNSAQKISTSAIESLLLELGDEISEAFAWSYSQSGGIFVGWSFRSATIVYDAKASQLSGRPIWHQRRSFDLYNKDRWRVNSITQAYGGFYVGDSEDGRIGEMSLDYFDEYDIAVRRVASIGPFKAVSGSQFWSEIQAIVEAGTGNSVDDNPEIRLSWSDDGGYTFNNELIRSTGRVGEYYINPSWHRLGMCRNQRIYRFEFSDRCKFSLLGVIGEWEDGR